VHPDNGQESPDLDLVGIVFDGFLRIQVHRLRRMQLLTGETPTRAMGSASLRRCWRCLVIYGQHVRSLHIRISIPDRWILFEHLGNIHNQKHPT